METSSFFNSVNGDRTYQAEDFAKYFARFLTSGVYSNPSTSLQVYASSGFTVNVSAGFGLIKGYMYQNTENKPLTVDVSDGSLSRKDAVVLQLDLTNRLLTTLIVKGTPSTSPQAPAPVRTDNIYELVLAEIYVPKGAISISQLNITDVRMDITRCGWVNSTIQVDTKTLFDQYKSWYDTKTVEFENQWDAWFADADAWLTSVKDQIKDDDHTVINEKMTNLETSVNNQNQTIENVLYAVESKADNESPNLTGKPMVEGNDVLHKGNVPSTVSQNRDTVSHFMYSRNSAALGMNSPYKMLWDVHVRDNQSEMNNGTFTAKEAGLYYFSAQIRYNGLTDGKYILLNLYKNGSNERTLQEVSTSTYGGASVGGQALVYLNAGDTVEIYYQTNASTTFVTGTQNTFFEGVRLY